MSGHRARGGPRLRVRSVVVAGLAQTAGLAVLVTGAVAQVVPSATAESRAMARAARAEREGRVEEARIELEQVLDENPGSSAALAMLSQLLTPRGRASEVLPRAERAVEAVGSRDLVAMTVWIRTLAGSGDPDSALAVARRWSTERPPRPAAYREWAQVLSTLGRSEDATDVLLTGREQTGSEADFAQELSVLYAAAGDYRRAAEEWLSLLAWGEPGVAAVTERLQSDGIDTGTAVEELRRATSRPGLPLEVRRGSLALALRIQRSDWARELAQEIVSTTPAETRRLVLREYYVEATNRGWSEDAAWAAEELERNATDEAERRHWQAMRADEALRSGKAEEAERTFSSLARAAEAGTETHRRSLRRLFSIRVAAGSPGAATLLEEYASTYPGDGAEAVEMAVELSDARIDDGDLDGAVAALDLPPAPADPALASRLEGQRGILALMDGRPVEAMSHLETAAFIPGGDPIRRTDALLLVNALDRADSASASALGRGMFMLRSRRNPDLLLDSAAAWSEPDATEADATLLALGAGALKSGGFRSEMRTVLERLVAAHPESAEAPAAMLELGRDAAPADPALARRWYERLVLEYPEHALAPIARQEMALLETGKPNR